MMGVPCIYINLLEGKSIGTRSIHSEYLPGHEREVHSSPKWTGVFELGEFPSVQVISGVMMASSLNPHNILYIYIQSIYIYINLTPVLTHDGPTHLSIDLNSVLSLLLPCPIVTSMSR